MTKIASYFDTNTRSTKNETKHTTDRIHQASFAVANLHGVVDFCAPAKYFCSEFVMDLPVIQTLLTVSVVESLNTNSLSSPFPSLKFTLGNYSNDILSTIDPDQILQVLIYVENFISAPDFIVLNFNSNPYTRKD